MAKITQRVPYYAMVSNAEKTACYYNLKKGNGQRKDIAHYQ